MQQHRRRKLLGERDVAPPTFGHLTGPKNYPICVLKDDGQTDELP